MNAIHSTNTNTNLKGCNFHFVQNLWKHFSIKIGRKQLKDKELRKHLRYLSCLPYVPVPDVVVAFEIIKKVPR